MAIGSSRAAMSQARKHTRLLQTLAALGTIAATTIFCLFVLPSGCIDPGPCGGACLEQPARQLPCTNYDAGACPVDAGMCVVTGLCTCVPGLPNCSEYICQSAETEQTCRSVDNCEWYVHCDWGHPCGNQFGADLCNSHPECYYQADKGC